MPGTECESDLCDVVKVAKFLWLMLLAVATMRSTHLAILVDDLPNIWHLPGLWQSCQVKLEDVAVAAGWGAFLLAAATATAAATAAWRWNRSVRRWALPLASCRCKTEDKPVQMQACSSSS